MADSLCGMQVIEFRGWNWVPLSALFQKLKDEGRHPAADPADLVLAFYHGTADLSLFVIMDRVEQMIAPIHLLADGGLDFPKWTDRSLRWAYVPATWAATVWRLTGEGCLGLSLREFSDPRSAEEVWRWSAGGKPQGELPPELHEKLKGAVTTRLAGTKWLASFPVH